MATKKLTKTQQKKALAIVAEWMGTKGYGDEYGGPAPTGPEAAFYGTGPELREGWTWPSTPTDTIILEGGPYDWAIDVSWERADEFKDIGLYVEPYAGYALCLYRA